MKIAVLSDLHAAQAQKSLVSWLCGDTPRQPASGHPVSSLTELIRRNSLSADYVVVPGDISDKCSRAGFPIAWDAINEVARQLRAQKVFATTGNHDIDSRQLHGKHPFNVVRSMLGNGYPFDGPNQASFWSHHFVLIQEGALILLILNSAGSHTNVEDAKRGAIDEETLERLSNELDEFDRKKQSSEEFRIAICHHHPHQHSSIGLADSELMKFGDRFLSLLESHRFGLLIHGHKHHPSLEMAAGGVNSPAVFAAGSFSATMSPDLATNSRNLFHIFTLEIFQGRLCGIVRSWQFHYMVGWKTAHENAADFPAQAGFGYRGSLSELAETVSKSLDVYTTSWNSLITRIPELNYLVPRDFYRFEEILAQLNVLVYRDRDGVPVAITRK